MRNTIAAAAAALALTVSASAFAAGELPQGWEVVTSDGEKVFHNTASYPLRLSLPREHRLLMSQKRSRSRRTARSRSMRAEPSLPAAAASQSSSSSMMTKISA